MVKFDKTYNSKILLLGEYTVLHGSQAIAMPFGKFNGRWTIDKDHEDREEIKKFASYLSTQYKTGKFSNFDTDFFTNEFKNGLAFVSNIPQGYGVGSSGSITAAMYDAFRSSTDLNSITELRSTLALMESHFHGSSSGLDPLVSFLNQPILIQQGGKVELLDGVNQSINQNFYLIDTGTKRSTSPLVQAFLAKREEDPSFSKSMNHIAILNDELITAYMINDQDAFALTIRQLSHEQFTHMSMWIPDAYKPLWREGLNSKKFSLKLNGAGGGGFLMIYIHDSTILADLSSYSLTCFI